MYYLMVISLFVKLAISTDIDARCTITDSDGNSSPYGMTDCVLVMNQYLRENQEFYLKTGDKTVIEFIEAAINEKDGIQMSSDSRTLRSLATFAKTTASTWYNAVGNMGQGGALLGGITLGGLGAYGSFQCALALGDNFVKGQQLNPVEWASDLLECGAIFAGATTVGATVGASVGSALGVTTGWMHAVPKGLFYAAYEGMELNYHYVPQETSGTRTAKAEL